jgi:uncharacterized protein
MKLIRFADLTSKPWKNGGGRTTEIVVSPEGAGFDDFDWRLSVAEVASDGPFSLFPGIDRTLTLIEGNGLAMAIENHEPVTLTTTSAPLAFPGDVPITATLVGGPIRDFNVMTRRGRFDHTVLRHDLKAGPLFLPRAGTRRIVSLGSGPLRLGGAELEVAFADVVEIPSAPSGPLTGRHDVLCIAIAEAAKIMR